MQPFTHSKIEGATIPDWNRRLMHEPHRTRTYFVYVSRPMTWWERIRWNPRLLSIIKELDS